MTKSDYNQHGCYVCGWSEHADTTAQGGHKFWDVADARAWFHREAQRHGGRDADAGVVNGASERAEAGQAL